MTLLSCSSEQPIVNDTNLFEYLEDKTFEVGAVIACAASEENTNNVLVFYYPEEGATDIKLYESVDADIDPNTFLNYELVNEESTPFFNGYLGKFTRTLSVEKWTIVTYELNGQIKVSNPIRIKQNTKPSVWSENVIIDQSANMMPKFSWTNNAFGDNAIYFQVISDAQDNLLSGTYTYENEFQYYNTTNVVLNITIQTPPNIIEGNFYKFTLMDVSEDNWVNGVIQKTFEAQ